MSYILHLNRIISCFILICALRGAGVGASVCAQTPSDTLKFTTDTLLIEAVRTALSSNDAPFSVSIRTRTEQATFTDAATSISSLTGQLPGIWVNDRQNTALGERITIRGLGWRAAFGVRGIQIILDGIPLTVADGQSVSNIIDPAFVTRTELIRGPAGSYWGNSSGGVLYLSTEAKRGDHPFYVQFQGGSFGELKENIVYQQQADNHKFKAYSSYKFEKGYRDYSQSKLLRSGVRGSYNLNNSNQLEYTGALLYMPQAEHPSGLTAEQVDEDPRQANTGFVDTEAGKQVTQGQLGLTYHRNGTAGLFTLTGYGLYRDLANPLPFGIITVNRLAGGLRSTLEANIENLEINAGIEHKFQHDDRKEFENIDGNRGTATVDQTENVQNQAAFLHSRYHFKSVYWSASLRFDRIAFSTDTTGGQNTGNRTFYAFSPGLGISFETGSSTFFANASTSFEAPTTTELVNRPGDGNGFNPELKPERTLGFEAGSRGSFLDGMIMYDVALYYLWIHDLLFPYQLETNGPVYYRNQGETRHRGIELSSSVAAFRDFAVDLTYTLTQAEFEKAKTLNNRSLRGNLVPGIPEHRFHSALTWTPDPFWIQFSGEYVNSYTVNNANTAFNDAYFTMDAKVSISKKIADSGVDIIPFFNLNNIFDARYNGSTVVNAFGGRYFEPAPGRNWRAGVTMAF